MTTVLKLGGSVITDKHEPETIDHDALETAATILGKASETTDLVLVHGGGSFGHPAAVEHGISADDGSHEAESVVAVHRAMGRLNDAVIDVLQSKGVPAVPVRPLSLLTKQVADTQSLVCPTEPVQTMLAEGFVPVLHGDVVVSLGQGATVVSGDDIVVAIAEALSAPRVGVCSTVPGVLDQNGEVIPEITNYAEVAAALGESDATDVTGGMAGKVKALLGVDGTASIFGLDELARFLETGEAGTIIR